MMNLKFLCALALLFVMSGCADDDLPTDNMNDPMADPMDDPMADPMDDPADDADPEVCLTAAEKELYIGLMEYRSENGLGNIPMSFSLTKVAQSHAVDLTNHYESFDDECNQHSWSDNGDWVACCYDDGHSDPDCMWQKPKEISNYEGVGYEIVAWSSDIENQAVNLWENSPPHNNMILNQDIWQTREWNSIGLGINGIYAVVWFGEEEDPDGNIDQCP